MSPENNQPEAEIDRAITEIRDEAIDPAVIEAAGARVWAQLSGAAGPHAAEHIRTCADFQALIPEYRAGRLTDARALLVKDHLQECVACRRVYEGKVVAFPGGSPAKKATLWSTQPALRWAVAAVLVVGVGFMAWTAAGRFGLFTHNGPATVQAVNGALYSVTAAGMQAMGVGQQVPDSVEIRTAKDSGAVVQLRDGSLVEMRERSSLSTATAAGDLTLRLAQGSVIVQAAKRRSGHLFVATADCRVAVTGTVFGVSAGVKGSRVSVVEGEVHVSGQGGEKVLHAGDQATTSATLAPVRVQDDIAWSRNYDRHLALLAQVQALQKSLNQVRMPELRYSSRILDRLPAGTVLYASIPNLGGYFAEAQEVFRERLGESPELRAWLEQKNGPNLEQVLAKLHEAGQYFGDEVVITGFAGPEGRMAGPVFVAEEKRPGFDEWVRKQGGRMRMESRAGLVAMSPDAASAAAVLDSAGGFSGTPLYARVSELYRNGAGLVFAADLAAINQANPNRQGARAAGNIQYFVGEQKQTPSRTDVRAVVGFSGERQGIASWLAAPAPMGALNYISPEATFVSAFVVKTPASIVDELLSLSPGSGDSAREQLAKTQAELGFDVRNDLAASLGGEFAVALDGPAFPVPSWKLVVETYDAQRLQYTLGKFVEAANREAAKRGKPGLRTAQETVNGRTYHMIAGADPNPLTEAHYTFAGGYLVAAPSRALVDRALQVRANGVGIGKSSGFLALLPHDRYANCSAVIYQNLGTTLAPLAGLLGSMTKMPPEGQKLLNDASNLKPTLVAAYGEPDRIEIAATGEQFRLPLAAILSGNLAGITGHVMPFGGGIGRRGRGMGN
jgi:hypothetical protein